MSSHEREQWPESGLRIEIWESDLSAYFGCLCLGMLHAIRAGVMPAQAGIWALGPPWAARLKGRVPNSLNDVLYETDEISAMASLRGAGAMNAMVDDMIQRVEAALKNSERLLWTIHPVSPDGTTSGWPVDLDAMQEGDNEK